MREEGRLRAAGRYIVLPESGESAGSGDEFQITHFIYVFTAKVARTSLRCNVFLTFSYPSHLKHLLLRAFLEDCLPERLSKVGVLAERGIKKSKKHHAIAPISNNLCFYSVFGRFCLKCCVLQCFERIFAQQLLRAHGLYRMDPQKTDQKHVFAKQQKNRDCKTCPIYSPLTPDQPPF